MTLTVTGAITDIYEKTAGYSLFSVGAALTVAVLADYCHGDCAGVARGRVLPPNQGGEGQQGFLSI